MGMLAKSEPPSAMSRARYLTPRVPTVAPVMRLRSPRRYSGRVGAAECVRELFARRGVSVVEVSEDLEVSEKQIAKWLTGEEAISLGDIDALANKRLALAILDALGDRIRNR